MGLNDIQHGIRRKQWTQELLRQKRVQDELKIKKYRQLTEEVLDIRDSNRLTLESLKVTTKVLDLNPEFNAVWNIRRDIIKALYDDLDAEFWEDELKFVMAQLKLFPKVYWIWNHRLWVLQNYPNANTKIWSRELAIVNKLLEADARNYHGWHYRRIVTSNLQRITGSDMNNEELGYATEKIKENISNFSAWHQRAQLIQDMLHKDEIENKAAFIDHEIEFVTNAMFTDAEDQAVWFYIKWLVRSDLVSKTLTKERYLEVLKSFWENITLINEDELEFSGKENVWCLKLLIVLQETQKELGVEIVDNIELYLNKLLEFDPLRKNRYLYLLERK
ncbi:Geranylgeranyl transferase type-2 subunit alpha [Nakaseomyces bracarensis]|uniref:Geranylgeranyl transferase type-2 subunit alpha n=1 Tax=Nakaseomyces bracarensis TaxID=273131 RepID=A0ABR4P0Q7_9SACH